jgi:valyl-tRNA synthetase
MKLPKVYEPGLYENDIYALWERSEAFKPTGKGDPYAVVMPPPNANANLHIGYELAAVLEDIAIRYHRLKGDNTLLVPGADHAGFETQVVYEKRLAKEGKSRFDFSREELYTQIWDFVAQNRGNFEKQMRQMGISCDWSRFTFTLDEKIVKLAYATFKKMWDEKLIYRGERLVNYCTFHQTGFADVEVVHEEAETPLYYLKYGPFTLATTRPETKFGDTAVAVHPDDDRYKEWVGKVVTVEGVGSNQPFEVRVIADEMVDPQFGTGVVKITPAHSFDDWEVAQRHNLPAVRVINHDGTMNEKAGQFRGLTVMEARKAVVEAMKEKGLIEKVDEHYKNRMGKCYKCGTVIEPMLMDQWFVDMQPLAKEAIKALKNNKITFYPDSKKDQLIAYLEGLRDWNISRQIAWGIPIPAFQNVDDPDDWIYDERVDQEIIQIGDKTYHRDPDVFDTWFSSSSWPYATLGYSLDGEPSKDFKEFYPTGLLETGGEILYPWVSRMVMLGLYVTGEVPFKEVYIHGYVMAEDGSKMSKSVGNVVDPSPVIEQYGSDALRMGIINGRSPAVNRGYDPRKVEEARNFANKLWNVARYIEDKIGDEFKGKGSSKAESAADHWVLRELQRTTDLIGSHLDKYRFSEAYEVLYHFVWDDFADWYIEASKAQPNKALLAYTLENVLKLAHPFAPFVTETIWQTLAWEGDSILAKGRWPETPHYNNDAADTFNEIKAIVAESRFITNALRVQGATLYYTDVPFLADNAELIKRMAKLGAVTEVTAGTGLYLTGTKYRSWLDIDVSTARSYQQQIGEKRQAQEKVIKHLEDRLANKSYVDNAPKKVVDQTKHQLQEARELLETLSKEYERFGTA